MMHVLLAASCAALVLFRQEATAAAGEGLKQTVATKLCSISAAAKSSAADLAARLQQIHDALTSARRTAQQQDVIAATKPEHATAAQVLRYYANAAGGAAESALSDWTGENTKILGHSLYTAGRIDELMLLLQNNQRDDKNAQAACIGADTTGNHLGNKDTTAKCAADDITQTKSAPADLDKTTTTELDGVTEIHAAAGSACALTKDLTTAYTSFSGTLPLIGGLINVHATNGLQTVNNNLATKSSSVKLFTNLRKHNADIKSKLTSELTTAPATLQKLKDLLKTPTTRSRLGPAARKALNWDKDKSGTELDDELKKIFGISDDATDGSYINSLKDFTLKVHKTATDTDNINLFSLTPDQLSEALSEALEQNRQQPASKPCTAKESKDKSQNPDTDTCASKGTGDDCKPPCKVEGKGDKAMCVVDPNYKPPEAEGAKESVTATNTTASNSFVIRKAPLLLAVLLF
uniref:Variant surface glycoprotein n=1 Tax=Trypanosoma brucei TaxID=5691 RepID=S5G7Q7_9TRYP|nr:variant surface glycoprotein [Trypanosoma brucei]